MDVSYISYRLVVSLDYLELFQSSAYLIPVVFYSCYGVFNNAVLKTYPSTCEAQGFLYSSE